MTFPIKEVPHEVKRGLEPYRSVLSKPQLNNLVRYTSGLMCLEKNRTVERINGLFVEEKDPSSLNRFLTEAPLPLAEMNAIRLKSVFRHVPSSREDVLVVDDTLSHKTGEKMEYAGFHYDGMTGSLGWGHSLVFSYCAGRKMSYPLGYDVYVHEDQCSETWKFATKLELAIEQVRWAKAQGFRGETSTFDMAYFSIDFIRELKELRMKHVSAIKENRRITIGRKSTHAEDYYETLSPSDFRKVQVKDSLFRIHEQDIYIPSIGKEKMIITLREKETKPRFIVTNHVDWSAERILSVALRRWEIEQFHKDVKQNLGLEDYRCRVIRGVLVHVLCVLIAYTLLIISRQASFLSVALDTIGKLCRWVRGRVIEIYTDWVRTTQNGFELIKKRFGIPL